MLWIAGIIIFVVGALFAVLLVAARSMFPSPNDVTDHAAARVVDTHLTQLEQTSEFIAAPSGLQLGASRRGYGCSDWFDLRQPKVSRDYTNFGVAPSDVESFYRYVWTAAGYVEKTTGSPTYHEWERDMGGWTARLGLWTNGNVGVEVTGEDATSDVCK